MRWPVSEIGGTPRGIRTLDLHLESPSEDSWLSVDDDGLVTYRSTGSVHKRERGAIEEEMDAKRTPQLSDGEPGDVIARGPFE
jgi:hypothetical protein